VLEDVDGHAVSHMAEADKADAQGARHIRRPGLRQQPEKAIEFIAYPLALGRAARSQ
jgi:hypothetical protein